MASDGWEPRSVCVVGLGHVGLPTAVAFARAGLEVAGLDVDADRVAKVASGANPLGDADLEGLADLVADKRLVPTTDPAEAVPGRDAVLLTVPTPVTVTREPDLSHVRAAGRAVAPHLGPGTLVVLESTVYPGCTEEVLVPVLEEASGLDVGDGPDGLGVAHCPERLNPGDPDHGVGAVTRVLGASSPTWAERGRALYERIGPDVHLVRDVRTAEAAKVIENVQRDLNIALVNELALIFDRLGVDVIEVLEAAGTKWNFHPYRPGPGVGGHCLPVDPYYLTWKAEALGLHPQVILAGRSINDAMPDHVVSAAVEVLNDLRRPVRGTPIAVLGLAYKANTGDVRNAPALRVARRLAGLGGEVRAVDPWVDEQAVKAAITAGGDVGGGAATEADHAAFEFTDLDAALDGARLCVVAVDHDAFDQVTPERLARAMAMEGGAGVLDCVARLDPDAVRGAGLLYRGLGRR